MNRTCAKSPEAPRTAAISSTVCAPAKTVVLNEEGGIEITIYHEPVCQYPACDCKIVCPQDSEEEERAH